MIKCIYLPREAKAGAQMEVLRLDDLAGLVYHPRIERRLHLSEILVSRDLHRLGLVLLREIMRELRKGLQ